MKRSFIDGDNKKPDKWVFQAESLDDREILNRFYDMLENRDDPNCCKACIGSGLSSRGRSCIPCRGLGILEPKGSSPLREGVSASDDLVWKRTSAPNAKNHLVPRESDEGEALCGYDTGERVWMTLSGDYCQKCLAKKPQAFGAAITDTLNVKTKKR